MKNLIIGCLVFFTQILSQLHAQNPIAQRIELGTDCNRSWTFNDSRFYKLIWDGMMKGKIQAYVKNQEKIQPASVADVYFLVSDAKNLENQLIGIDGEVVNLSSREDSIALLTPNYYEIIGSYEAKEPLAIKKEWLRLVYVYELDYGYYFSYPELIQYLDQSKSYWVNPFNSTDSVSFSKALQDERYVFEWMGETSGLKFYDGYRYAASLNTNSYKFTGFLTRYAWTRSKANYPYAAQRPTGNIISILMKAYERGELNGYDWNGHGEPVIFTQQRYYDKVIHDMLDNADWLYAEGNEIVEVRYDLYAYQMDMFGVHSKVSIESKDSAAYLQNGEPLYFVVGSSWANYNNYVGIDYPFIVFNYSEALSVLEKTGLMWYASDNHGDSCTLANAIKTNRVFWNSGILSDQQGGMVYSTRYQEDSAKFIIANPQVDDCVQSVISRTQKPVLGTMNVSCANSNFPSNTSVPFYLHYRASRMLDQKEDTTLTFLKDLSAYIVDKALQGKISIYANDSLRERISAAEFRARMTVPTLEYDAEGNEIETNDTLPPSCFHVAYVGTDFYLNSKGKLTKKDRSLRLVIPVEYDFRGIEVSLAAFSYAELELLMKKDKKGKTLLKQLAATQKQALYVTVEDPYGDPVYNVWGDNADVQLKATHTALQPYLKKTVKY